MTKHLVQYSTGTASAEVAWRVIQRHGVADIVLITADTKKEHPDNWRFAHEAHKWLGEPEWTVLCDGRTPMQVGRDHRAVPNNRMAICSRVLKRELIRAHIDATYDPADAVVYLGFDWTEPQRMTATIEPFAPWRVAAPLMDPPYLWKEQINQGWRDRGIQPPELYKYGLAHANCGGFCVRGGQAQWALMLQVDPDGYREWEGEEEETRQLIGKDASILRDRTKGKPGVIHPQKTRPLSLRQFRERIERQPSMFDETDWGACGCFMTDDPPADPAPGAEKADAA